MSPSNTPSFLQHIEIGPLPILLQKRCGFILWTGFILTCYWRIQEGPRSISVTFPFSVREDYGQIDLNSLCSNLWKILQPALHSDNLVNIRSCKNHEGGSFWSVRHPPTPRPAPSDTASGTGVGRVLRSRYWYYMLFKQKKVYQNRTIIKEVMMQARARAGH